MKKMFFLILLLSIKGFVFAQEEKIVNNPKNVILFPFGLILSTENESFGWGIMTGGLYERRINNYLSLGGGIQYEYYTKYSINSHAYNILGLFRIYPQGNALANLYLGTQIGYTIETITYNQNTSINNLFIITPIIGYKFDKNKIFTYELFVGYNLKFGEMNYPIGVTYNTDSSILDKLAFGILYGIIIDR
jgi:hypothetical protein